MTVCSLACQGWAQIRRVFDELQVLSQDRDAYSVCRVHSFSSHACSGDRTQPLTLAVTAAWYACQ